MTASTEETIEILTKAYAWAGTRDGVHIDHNCCKERMAEAYAALADSGLCVVPVEPSEAMLKAGEDTFALGRAANPWDRLDAIFKAMIQAGKA